MTSFHECGKLRTGRSEFGSRVSDCQFSLGSFLRRKVFISWPLSQWVIVNRYSSVNFPEVFDPFSKVGIAHESYSGLYCVKFHSLEGSKMWTVILSFSLQIAQKNVSFPIRDYSVMDHWKTPTLGKSMPLCRSLCSEFHSRAVLISARPWQSLNGSQPFKVIIQLLGWSALSVVFIDLFKQCREN